MGSSESPMSRVKLLAVALAVGILTRLVFEYSRYRSWDGLEDEVEAWRESPRGRFNAWLDGIESPE